MQWSKTDDYHIASACGRFTVCRLSVMGEVVYIAFKRPYNELGSVRLPGTASDAQRVEAIRECQGMCEAVA
jgi:hypothetical protein